MIRLGSITGVAVALLAGLAARADPPPAAKLSASEILKKMDSTNNDYADQTLNEQMTVVDVDNTRRSYSLTVRQKGAKRLVEFTSGESKGMSILVEDRNSVYVYLPGFKKVRRVSANNMSQSMVGSDLSSEDSATVSWALNYDATLDKEDDTSWWLVLTPKAGAKGDYGKIVQRVDKTNFLQLETHYFDKSGQEVKRLICSNPTSFDGIVRNKMAIFSDPRTGHRTELETTSAKYNQGLSDDLFTVRQLEWGR
jgi:outer membrane lipoprotein-sorting protein